MIPCSLKHSNMHDRPDGASVLDHSHLAKHCDKFPITQQQGVNEDCSRAELVSFTQTCVSSKIHNLSTWTGVMDSHWTVMDTPTSDKLCLVTVTCD